MEIKQIPTNKIRPDKNQPRKSFDEDHVKDMAQSIKGEGIINPIEIDKNYVIITGELRWRAAKEAGLETVPCKMIDVKNPNERFIRQVIENIHHNTMTAWDTAEALKRMMNNYAKSLGIKGVGRPEEGVNWGAKRIGKSREYIRNLLSLLNEQANVVRALKENKIKWTPVIEARRAPKEFHKELKDRLIKGEFQQAGAHGMRALATALKNYPEEAKNVLKHDFTGKDARQTRDLLKREVPGYAETPIADAIEESISAPTEIGNLAIEIYRWLDKNPPETIAKFQRKRVLENLVGIKRAIDEWIK